MRSLLYAGVCVIFYDAVGRESVRFERRHGEELTGPDYGSLAKGEWASTTAYAVPF